MRGKAVAVEELELPGVLYKFRDYNNEFHKKALYNQELYIPCANEFNDPQDSKIPFRWKDEDITDENIFKKALELAKIENPGLTETQYHEKAFEASKNAHWKDEHFLEEFDNDTYKKICRDFGVYCLTPNIENTLMWSYYASSHTGFAIGYNTIKLVACKLFGMGGMVQYKSEFPRISMFYRENDHLLWDVFFTKSVAWKHEDEYRLLHIYKHGKVHRLTPEFISEVVLGCNFPQVAAIQLVERLQKEIPHVRIYQMKLKKSGFGLEKEIVFDPSTPFLVSRPAKTELS